MLKSTFDPNFLISECQVLLIIKIVLILKMLQKKKQHTYCQQKQVYTGKFTSSTNVIQLLNKTVIAKELKTFILP